MRHAPPLTSRIAIVIRKHQRSKVSGTYELRNKEREQTQSTNALPDLKALNYLANGSDIFHYASIQNCQHSSHNATDTPM